MKAERPRSRLRSSQRGLQALLRAIWDYSAPQLPGALLLLTVAAILEGAGVVLLLPLAEMIFAGEAEQQGGLTGNIQRAMADLGVATVTAQLSILGLGLVLLLAARALVLTHRDVLLARMSHGFVDHVRSSLFAVIARADWRVIKHFGRARLLDTMTADVARLVQTTHALSRGIVTSTLGLAYLAAAFLVSVSLGMLLLVLVALGTGSAVVWSRRSHTLGEQLTRANRGLMQETTRFLEGLKAAKVSHAENELARRFTDVISATREVQIAFLRRQSRLTNFSQILAAMVALSVLLLGYSQFRLSGGELLVMAAIVLRLAPALNSTFGGMQSIVHALPAFAAIRELEVEIAMGSGIPPVGTEDVARAPSIDVTSPVLLRDCAVEIVDTSGAQLTLLRTGQIDIEPGTLVHVSGPSGAGKSTFAELLAGLHLPARGEVRRGGSRLDAANVRQWQTQISFAPQEPFIFHGSVRENLLWPDVVAEEGAIWGALAQAEAAELVRRLPLQLDEQLLDGGARLSGGERQRLCLARALLRKSALLILDEATSAMDPDLERRIMRSLKANLGDRILLIVCHSENGRGHADLCIRVEKGEARAIAGE